MSHRRKLARQAPPKTLYPELGNWRGFQARRRTPRLALLSFLACVAVAGTLVMAIGGHSARGLNSLWLLALAVLQLVIVAECRLVFRGPLRVVLPVVSAIVIPVVVAVSLAASPLVTIGLGLIFLALVVIPQRWLDQLVG